MRTGLLHCMWSDYVVPDCKGQFACLKIEMRESDMAELQQYLTE